MALEQYSNSVPGNLAQTTINQGGGIASGDATVTVAAFANFPIAANYRILIDSEICLVTGGVGTTTWNITRGAEGTTAASHANGAAITHVLTRDGLLSLGTQLHLSDSYLGLPSSSLNGRLFLPTDAATLLRDNGTQWSPWGPIYAFTSPPASLLSSTATTLSGNGGSIGSGATTGLVASSSGFPATPFLVQIGSEDIKVTNVSSLTWTIVRGYNGTTAASHNDGVAVTLINWEWVNQGTATFSGIDGHPCLDAPSAGATNNTRILKNVAPATPYTVTAYFEHAMFGDQARAGLLFRESSSGKFTMYEYLLATSTSPVSVRNTYYSSPTTPVSAAGTIQVASIYPWMRIRDDGVNRIFSVSRDGQHWVQTTTEGRTNNLTADEYGWGIDPVNAETMSCMYSLTVG